MVGPAASVPDSNKNTFTTRRHLLSGLIGGVALLSGCSDLIESEGTDTPSTSTASPTANGTEDGTETMLTDHDLRLETYTNSEYGYRVQYPAEWSVDESAPRETIFRADDNMAVLEAKVPGRPDQDETLDDVLDTALSSTRRRMDDVEVLDEEDVTLESGESAYVIQFRYDNPNDGGGMLRTSYLLTFSEGFIHQLEFAMEEAEYTEEDEELITAIMNSYVLTGQQPDERETTDQPTETEDNGDEDGNLDLSSLDTYTNDSYGYSIDYPAHWEIDEGDFTVEIVNEDGDIIRVFAESISDDSYSMDETADEIIESIESDASESSLSKQGQTTIESGQSGVLIRGSYDLVGDEAEMLRNTVLVTAGEDTSYVIKFIADADDWSSSIRGTVKDILTSFTIDDGSIPI